MLESIQYYFSHFDWEYNLALWAHIPKFMLAYFIQLAPYVVAGSLFGEYLKFTSWTKLTYRVIVKYPFLSLISATLLGILSPLCTYGTVPVMLSLYAAGVPSAPLIAFLAASSMMNPQLFIMTLGGLGTEIALVRLLGVFIFGMFIGIITKAIPEKFIVKNSLRGTGGQSPESRGKPPFEIKTYLRNVGKNLLFVGRGMLIGIFIAAVVDILPINLLGEYIDTTTPLGIFIAAFAGIPLYACGGGTIPMLASMLESGLSRGSAMAFMLCGPATRITSLAAVGTIIRKRFIAVYVLLLLVFSVAFGIVYQQIKA